MRDVTQAAGGPGSTYTIKVGYWRWLRVKQLTAARQHWLPVAPNVTGFFHDLNVPRSTETTESL